MDTTQVLMTSSATTTLATVTKVAIVTFNNIVTLLLPSKRKRTIIYGINVTDIEENVS